MGTQHALLSTRWTSVVGWLAVHVVPGLVLVLWTWQIHVDHFELLGDFFASRRDVLLLAKVQQLVPLPGAVVKFELLLIRNRASAAAAFASYAL